MIILLADSLMQFSQVLTVFLIFVFSGGRTIIFTETKESASELSSLIPGSRALHGDIAQAQREVSDSVLTMLVPNVLEVN